MDTFQPTQPNLAGHRFKKKKKNVHASELSSISLELSHVKHIILLK